MPTSKGSLRNWLARRKTSVVLALIAVLAGMILLNPALFDLWASPPNQAAFQGPVFSRVFEREKLTISLYLSTYNGESGSLPGRAAVANIKLAAVESKNNCRRDFRASIPGTAQYDNRTQSGISAPLQLAEFQLTRSYIGHYACFWITMKDPAGNLNDHFYVSGQITGASLIFDHDFDQGEDDSSIISRLRLRSYNGQTQNLPSAARIYTKAKKVAKQSECKAASFSSEEPDHVQLNSLFWPLRSYQSGYERVVQLGPSHQYYCYQFWLDIDGTGRWQNHYYVTSTLPRYYGSRLSSLSVGAPTFRHELITHSDGRKSIALNLIPPAGQSNDGLYNIEIRSVATENACVDGLFSETAETAADFFKTHASYTSLPAQLINHDLSSQAAHYNRRFACFRITLYSDPATGKRYEIRQHFIHYAPENLGRILGYDLPEQLTLEGALAIFKRQLTPTGRQLADQLEFAHDYNLQSCGYQYAADSAPADKPKSSQGCWHRERNTVYVSANIFRVPLDAGHEQTLAATKQAVGVLAHEFFHAVESREGNQHASLYATTHDCYQQSKSGLFKKVVGWFQDDERLSYYEPPSDKVEKCLHDDEYWGGITQTLKALYATEGDRLIDYPSNLEPFSIGWYQEAYAETPISIIDLPSTTASHYNRYFRNRTDFVKTLENQRYYFQF